MAEIDTKVQGAHYLIYFHRIFDKIKLSAEDIKVLEKALRNIRKEYDKLVEPIMRKEPAYLSPEGYRKESELARREIIITKRVAKAKK